MRFLIDSSVFRALLRIWRYAFYALVVCTFVWLLARLFANTPAELVVLVALAVLWAALPSRRR